MIFVHVHKTGGQSIQSALKGRIEKTGHTIASEIIKDIGINGWNSNFTFCFVRNPWDRVVSVYHFYKKKRITKGKPYEEDFETWLKDWIKVSKPLHKKHRFIRNAPQCHWMFEGDKQLVNFIGRFENLNKDFQKICEINNFKSMPKLEHKNKTEHKHYSEYYNDNTRKLIYEYHKEDVERLNYSFV